MKFDPIGYLKSCYPDKFGVPRQPGLAVGARAQLQVRREFQPEQALQGLEKFSHVWLIFIFHQNSNSRYHAKVHPPRLGGASIGLFATRSPHRPNPLGLSLVELEKIKGDTLFFRGADLMDGTPILDIKPYLPEIESKPGAYGGWTDEKVIGGSTDIQVQISDFLEIEIRQWAERIDQSSLRELIVQTLSLDPRPLVYRGFEGQQRAPYRTRHAVRLYDGDIHFEFKTPTIIELIEIKFPT